MPDNLEWINLAGKQGGVQYARTSHSFHAFEAGENVVFVTTAELARVPLIEETIEIARVLYEKLRHISADPQWAITTEDFDRLHRVLAKWEAK